MKLSIIGAGNVGMALARALVRAGESVTLGVPDPAKYQASVAALGPAAKLVGTEQAIADGDVVILAVPYPAALAIAISVPDWQGKTLVELAFSWLLARPIVSSVIAGATKPEQIEANVKAADWALTAEDLAAVDAVTAG